MPTQPWLTSLLTFCVLAAPAAAQSGPNLARGKRASQSSTGFGGAAARATDGRTDGVYNAGSVTHTNLQTGWLEVDLGEPVAISTVVVYNRTDCCAERLKDARVELAMQPCAAPAPIVSRTVTGPEPKAVFTFADAPFAQYVCIRHTRREYLSVAELEVYAPEAPPAPAPTEPAPSAPADAQQPREQMVIGGKTYVVVEGDILVEADRFAAAQGKLTAPPRVTLSNDGVSYLAVRSDTEAGQISSWPEGVVPYVIAEEAQKFRGTILNAQAIIQKKVNVTFMEKREDQDQYLAFVWADATLHPAHVCNSGLGAGRPTVLALRDLCGNDLTVVLHEILHALGAVHEQSRPDRDENVEILWDNIEPKYWNQFAQTYSMTEMSPYDFRSAMHYFDTAFSIDGKRKTIVPRPGKGPVDPVRGDLSPGDVAGLLKWYPSTRRAVLFQDTGYRGDRLGVMGDVPDLKGLGYKHRASSLKLQGGVSKVALWDKPNYQGRCIVYRGDTPRFEGFNDDFASLKVDRECSSAKATVFKHTNFEGTALDLNGDTADLGALNNEVSSIRVGDGITLALFSEPSYRGTCATLTANAVKVGKATGSNDSISSIWVGRACPGPAATFFKDTNYRGRTVQAVGDVRNMKDIGFNDAVSSIRLTGGMPIAVYKDTEFRGRCTTVRGDMTNMRGSAVGNDAVSSLRVRWTCEGGPVQ